MSCCRPIEEEGTEAQRGATTCPETRGQSAPRPEPFFSAETTCFSAASPVPFLCWALPLRSSPGLRPGPFLLPPSTFPGQSPVFRNHPRGTAATLSPAGAPLLSARRFPQLLPTGQRHGSRKHGAPPFPQSLFSLADSLGRPNRTAIPPLPESGTSAPSPPGFVHPPERGSLQDRAPASLSSPVSSRWSPHRHSPSCRDHLTAVPGMSHARSLSLSFLPESSRNCASNIFRSWILAYLNLTQRPFSSHLKCQLF